MEGSPQGHAFEAHTAEVRLRLWGKDFAEVLVEAARALVDLMLGDGADGPLAPPLPVAVRAPDRARLLAAWIDELVFLSETRKLVFTDVRVDEASSTEVRATVRGVAPSVLRTQVKAATLHDLAVEEREGGVEAQVVLDV